MSYLFCEWFKPVHSRGTVFFKVDNASDILGLGKDCFAIGIPHILSGFFPEIGLLCKKI
jgi:hypothetical protein